MCTEHLDACLYHFMMTRSALQAQPQNGCIFTRAQGGTTAAATRGLLDDSATLLTEHAQVRAWHALAHSPMHPLDEAQMERPCTFMRNEWLPEPLHCLHACRDCTPRPPRSAPPQLSRARSSRLQGGLQTPAAMAAPHRQAPPPLQRLAVLCRTSKAGRLCQALPRFLDSQVSDVISAFVKHAGPEANESRDNKKFQCSACRPDPLHWAGAASGDAHTAAAARADRQCCAGAGEPQGRKLMPRQRCSRGRLSSDGCFPVDPAIGGRDAMPCAGRVPMV